MSLWGQIRHTGVSPADAQDATVRLAAPLSAHALAGVLAAGWACYLIAVNGPIQQADRAQDR